MIYDIADNGARTVAVGANGLILVSNDGGATWDPATSGVTNALHGVTFGYAFEQGRWVVVGENGLILTSPDAYAWTVATPFTGQTLYAVAWAGVFLTVGAGGVLGLSADLGLSWEPKSSDTTSDLYDITVAEGVYTIVGADDTVIVGSLATLELEVVLAEVVWTGAIQANTGTFTHARAEDVQLAAGYGWQHFDDATQTLVEGGALQYAYMTDSFGAYTYGVQLEGSMQLAVTEGVSLLSGFPPSAIFQRSVTAALQGTAVADRLWVITRTVVESLALADAITSAQAVLILDRLALLSPTVAAGQLSQTLTEEVSLQDGVAIAYAALVAELMTLTASGVGKFEIALSIVERLTSSGALQSRYLAVTSVAVALAMVELSEAGLGAEAAEQMVISSELLDRALAIAQTLEQLTVGTTAEAALLISMPVRERVAAQGSVFSQAFFQEQLQAGVSFTLNFSSGAGEEFTGWVMNTKNMSVTEYQNYPFNSLAKFGGSYLGGSAQGLFRLGGDDDAGAPIEARLMTGVLSFPTMVRVPEVFLTFRASGEILLLSISEERVERWYTITGSEYLAQRRGVLCRGAESVQWQFGLQNIDGADLDIAKLELVPVALSRRNSRR